MADSPYLKLEELPGTPVPQRVLDVIEDNASLPVCDTCGTQFSVKPKGNCPCCEDPRQWIPPYGQRWTTLGDLAAGRTHSLLRDTEDPRIAFIQTDPPFAISQTPILISTHEGSYIWDCHAPFTPKLAAYLTGLTPKLKAMAISHPHFFSTSLVWARALDIPLYICEADKEWYQRRGDIKPEDHVHFWRGEETIGPNVRLIQCGGHFPGSCVLYWDRSKEPGDGPKSGVLLVADTIMVQPTQKAFTFMWSYPNMIPLRPAEAKGIMKALENVDFGVASSTWPSRMIRENAKDVLKSSFETYLKSISWKEEGGQLRPRVEAV